MHASGKFNVGDKIDVDFNVWTEESKPSNHMIGDNQQAYKKAEPN